MPHSPIRRTPQDRSTIAKQTLLVALAALFFAGCRTSDRTIELSDKLLKVEPPVQLQPPGSILFAFSPDGEQMAVLREAAEGRMFIQSVKTKEVVASHEVGESFPFMFGRDSRSVFLVIANGIGEYDLSSGKTKAIVEGYAYGPSGRNAAQTVTTLADSRENYIAINANGHYIRSQSRPLFDQYGNAWAKADGGWQMLSPSQPAAKKTDPPTYLVPDQSALKGAMSLFTDEQTTKRKGAEAYVSAVWLDHTGALGDRRSAIVFAGVDVFYAGFVPKQDLVWIISNDGSYLVPIQSKPK